MKLPRDLSGRQFAQALETLGYASQRQTGSHIRLLRAGDPVHRVTIPDHDQLRIGTLNAILNEIAGRLEIPKDDLVRRLFG